MTKQGRQVQGVPGFESARQSWEMCGGVVQVHQDVTISIDGDDVRKRICLWPHCGRKPLYDFAGEGLVRQLVD